MSDEPALLAAIRAMPDEDTPRLVYADWLQENGQEARAEFIRVQVELARHSADPFPKNMPFREREVAKLRTGFTEDGTHYSLEQTGRIFKITRDRVRQIEAKARLKVDFAVLKRVGVLRRRERTLWSVLDFDLPAVFRGWPAGVASPASGGRAILRRGFVESVTCSAADWLTHGDAITAAHPVRKVALSTRPGWQIDFATLRERHGFQNDVEWVYEAFVKWGDKPRMKFSHILTAPKGVRPNAAQQQANRDALLNYINQYKWMGDKDSWWPGIEFTLPGVTLQAHTLTGLVHVTEELLDDSAFAP